MTLNDSDAPQKIQEYVRAQVDIEVYEYIRRGAVGEVYFGKRKKLDDDVVLKFYHGKEDFDSSEEAVILRGIGHPNILSVIDLRFIQPSFALFMSPKIDGGDLQQLIDGKPIPTWLALDLMEGVLLGVNELHSKHHLVHRDLKAGNVLLNLADSRAIIADLGAAKKVGDPKGHTTGSKATWIYLPPESISKDEYYFQSDIYQVGILMYQLLGGFFPLYNQMAWLNAAEQKNINKIQNSIQRDLKISDILTAKILSGKIINTSTLPGYLGKQFKAVVNKATNPDLTKRYKNAAEFLQDIHALRRYHPNFTTFENGLLIEHSSGNSYRITEGKDGYKIEKKVGNVSSFRFIHTHDGKWESVLAIAMKK